MGQNPAVPHHTRYMSLLRLGTLAGCWKSGPTQGQRSRGGSDGRHRVCSRGRPGASAPSWAVAGRTAPMPGRVRVWPCARGCRLPRRTPATSGCAPGPRSAACARRPPVFSQPKPSSTSLRRRWLSPYPACRVVRPSTARRRRRSLRATCGVGAQRGAPARAALQHRDRRLAVALERRPSLEADVTQTPQE